MKRLLVFGLLAAVLGLSAREPSMKVTEKQIDRKGVKLTQKEWKVKFHHSDMVLKNMIGADGKLVKKAWGDFFCGLTHGTISNGSWDIWQFVSAMDKKWKVLPEKEPASKVSFVAKTGISNFLEITGKSACEIALLKKLGNKTFLISCPSYISFEAVIFSPLIIQYMLNSYTHLC